MTDNPTASAIRQQVKLPARVALSVALQGIQVRFGRSLVTVLGVLLGIAFLMSVLTAQVVKSGVEAEQRTRNDIRRMLNILRAEMGHVEGRTLGVIQTGPLNENEQRMFRRLAADKPARFNWHLAAPTLALPEDLAALARTGSLPAVAEDASALLVVGGGDVADLNLTSVASASSPLPVCFTRPGQAPPRTAEFNAVLLDRELREDELAQAELERRKAAFRNAWIVVVSLLVTVIGITNSMLMSVTERFREIGTMKCLGALSAFIRHLFLIESSLLGLVGAVGGAAVGALFSLTAYGFTYGFALVLGSLNVGRVTAFAAFSVGIGMALSMIAAIYPARFASRMLPAHALRSNI